MQMIILKAKVKFTMLTTQQPLGPTPMTISKVSYPLHTPLQLHIVIQYYYYVARHLLGY